MPKREKSKRVTDTWHNHALQGIFLKIADKLRMPYDPSPSRRVEVIGFLSRRPILTHEEWQRRFASDVPVAFVQWFRETCSEHFGYDLSAALPDDKLVEDLGMYDATFGDVDTDILQDFRVRFGAAIPENAQICVTTFGEFLRTLWSHAKKPMHELP